MRPFKTKVDIIAGDKASSVIAKITSAAQKMTKGVTQSANIAGNAFATFSARAGMAAKKASLTMNNLNAKVNGFFRGIGKGLGTLGQLGVGLSFLALASVIVDANTQVDASFASLSAITGKTGREFDAFKVQVAKVAKEQRLFVGDTAKAFEIVASAKPELLADAKAMAEVTNAAITLSKASGDDLAQSSLNLVGVLNQFNLSASEAQRVMNTLAAGSVEGSATITDVAAAMKNFGAVANASNITMEQSVALIEVMGSKSIFAEEAGTKLRGSILKLKQAGVGYASGQFNINDALTETQLKLSKLSTAKKKDAYLQKMFGAENITTGQILMDNVENFNKLTKGVTGTDWAVTQMNIKANTFSNRLKEVADSFKNSVTATDAQAGSMQKLKDALLFVSENMDKIIKYAIIGIETFVAFKVAVYGLRVVTTAYNVAVGIQAGLMKKASIAMKTNLTAIKAMNIVTKISTAIQWAFNASLWANPLTWIVIAVLALIAAIAALIYYWKDIVNWIKTSDNWFAKLLRAAIYPIIMAFKILKFVIGWLIDTFSALIEWLKTSDNWFAKLVRGPIQALIWLFQATGAAIDWVSEKFSALVEWLKTSDSWFAQFSRGVIGVMGAVYDAVVWLIDGAIKPLQEAFDKIGKAIEFFSGETQKELGVDIKKDTKTHNITKMINGMMGQDGGLGTVQAGNPNSELTKSLAQNTKALDDNTKAGQKEWTGKFRTTILRDLNLAGATNVQKDLAIAAVSNETDNAIAQKDIISSGKIPDKVVTSGGTKSSKNKSNNVNGSITINVVNKTGGKFGLEIEGSGVNVVTTGNQW